MYVCLSLYASHAVYKALNSLFCLLHLPVWLSLSLSLSLTHTHTHSLRSHSLCSEGKCMSVFVSYSLMQSIKLKKNSFHFIFYFLSFAPFTSEYFWFLSYSLSLRSHNLCWTGNYIFFILSSSHAIYKPLKILSSFHFCLYFSLCRFFYLNALFRSSTPPQRSMWCLVPSSPARIKSSKLNNDNNVKVCNVKFVHALSSYF